jgi:hypothetical protein
MDDGIGDWDIKIRASWPHDEDGTFMRGYSFNHPGGERRNHFIVFEGHVTEEQAMQIACRLIPKRHAHNLATS